MGLVVDHGNPPNWSLGAGSRRGCYKCRREYAGIVVCHTDLPSARDHHNSSLGAGHFLVRPLGNAAILTRVGGAFAHNLPCLADAAGVTAQSVSFTLLYG